MIASAVSAGARPPRSSPTGPRSRASSSSRHAGGPQPLAAIALRLAAADRADVAAAAVERLDDRRLVELHVVGQDRDRVVRPQADLLGDLVGPADDQPVDRVGREAFRRRERRAAVDDDRLVAQLAGEPDERPRDLDRADDDEPGLDRERLDEDRAALDLDGPRGASEQRVPGRGLERGVGGRRAQRPLDDRRSRRRSPAPAGPRPRRARTGRTPAAARRPAAGSRRRVPAPSPRRRSRPGRPARSARRSSRRTPTRRPTPPRR